MAAEGGSTNGGLIRCTLFLYFLFHMTVYFSFHCRFRNYFICFVNRYHCGTVSSPGWSLSQQDICHIDIEAGVTVKCNEVEELKYLWSTIQDNGQCTRQVSAE